MTQRLLIDVEKKSRLDAQVGGLNGALEKVAEAIAPVEDNKSLSAQLEKINETIAAGFKLVAEAIAKTQPLPQPQPKMRGTIMADYQIPDDQPDNTVVFHLSATDAEGQPITDPAILASLKFEVESSNPDAFSVALDAESFDPMNRVGTYHVGAPGQAAVTSNLKDADGNLLATGTDGFTVTTGKVALGAVKSEFTDLTPIEG